MAYEKHHEVLKISRIDTPIGQMIVISDEEAICLLKFVDSKSEREVENIMFKTKSTVIPGTTGPIASISRELASYFDGTTTKFQTPLRLLGSPFQMLVWNELLRIPYGQTRSYAEQAGSMGKQTYYRATANANGANKIAVVIPCHRVINSNGNLGGYRGGILRKKWLIEHEKRYVE